MDTMKITKELKDEIEKNQNQLKAGIRNHQRLLGILESDPENTDVQKQLQTEQERIIVIGLEQKLILDKLRKEYKVFRKQAKLNGTKNSIDDKRFNLTIALRRAQKQTIIQRSTPTNASLPLPPITSSAYHSTKRQRHQPSPPVPDDYDSSDAPQQQIPSNNVYGVLGSHQSSTHSSPERPLLAASFVEEEAAQGKRALFPEELGQVVFLQYLHLATHEVFKEMQNKRFERKRRSTANPQFLYTRGWDISKRKRNFYLSNLTSSPPTTRQSVQRNKVAKLQQQALSGENVSSHVRVGSSALDCRSSSASPITETVNSGLGVTLPGITHLPSGLTIEPVREEQTVCIDCKQPGNLSICEECSHAFHVTCHNRPLVSTPRHCPVCYTDAKEARLRQQQMAAQAHSPITINNVQPRAAAQAEQEQQDLLLIEERLQLKSSLLNRNKLLTVQLGELQDQHSKLTISLRAQQRERDDLVSDQGCTQEKIQKILTFITKIKGEITEKVSEDNDLTEERFEIVVIEEKTEASEENCTDADNLEIEHFSEGTVLDNISNLPVLSKLTVEGNLNKSKIIVVPTKMDI